MATSNQTPLAAQDSCPECGSRIQTSSTEHACTGCGLVVESDPIDHGPDWRAYSSHGENPERASPTDPDRVGNNLGSDMGHRHERDHEDERQNTLHTRSKTRNKRERNRRYAIGEINRITSALDLSDSLRKQAARLFRTLHEQQGALGRDLDELSATAVYTTCRINQRGLAPNDFEAVARASGERIAREHKWLCNQLDIGSPPPCPRQRIRVVASECGLSGQGVDRALTRLEDVPDEVVYRGSPSTLAAALLWSENEGLVTQARAAEVAGVTPAALRGRLESLA